MEKKKALKVLELLDSFIKNPQTELEYSSTFELLVAVMLSAQCTDKRVNEVTRVLFKKYNTPEQFKDVDLLELEQLIHSCGFYRNKAKAIISASQTILAKFGGQVPSRFEDLTSLAGVGRKTANVMIAEAFKGDAFAVDTHVLRVSNRLGLVKTDNPDKCEARLKKIFPQEKWSRLHYQMVLFGRYTCKAMSPQCANCVFAAICANKKEK